MVVDGIKILWLGRVDSCINSLTGRQDKYEDEEGQKYLEKGTKLVPRKEESLSEE